MTDAELRDALTHMEATFPDAPDVARIKMVAALHDVSPDRVADVWRRFLLNMGGG